MQPPAVKLASWQTDSALPPHDRRRCDPCNSVIAGLATAEQDQRSALKVAEFTVYCLGL